MTSGGSSSDGGSSTDGGSPTDGGSSTDGGSDSGSTGGDGCGVPLAPGTSEYECFCEFEPCSIQFDDVASIPDFYDNYCECLCQSQGCGSAAGGEAAGGD
ncbi:MAG: hypothetical protein IAG13_11550 [Deltaproteobacteria bacterium]|nr:hypothetical protein [Nannocystaceae bacterium]